MKYTQVILGWIVIYSLVACVPSNGNVPEDATQAVITPMTSEPVIATQGAVPEFVSTQPPDVVVNARQFNQVIELIPEQVLKVEPPNLEFEWQVDYDPVLFELLTPLEMVRAPGSEGWSFRAIESGNGQIVLTSIVSCSEPPCPLMPMRFQLNVQVQ